jgi:glycosyltransferase involved in cell wall biosynthesis
MNLNVKALCAIDDIIKNRKVSLNVNFLIKNIFSIKNLDENKNQYIQQKVKNFLNDSSNWTRSLDKCHFFTMLMYGLGNYAFAASMLKNEIILRQKINEKVEIFWYLVQSAFLSKKHEVIKDLDQAFQHLIGQFDNGIKTKNKFKNLREDFSGDLDVLVVTHQFLSLSHAPTLDTLNYCKALIELGRNVELLVTNEVPHSPTISIGIPFNINNDFLGRKHVEFEGKNISVNGLKEILSKENIENTVADYVSKNPKLVILIGGYSIYAELLGVHVPLVTLPCSTDYYYSKYAKILVWFSGDTYRANQITLEYDLKSQKIITDIDYQYNLPSEQKKLKKSDFGISDQEIVAVIVGNRLDQELDDDFINFLDELNSVVPFAILMIGQLSKEKKNKINLKLKSQLVFIDFYENLYDLYNAADFYINPRRSGGGTSAAYALCAGVPVFTVNYGDVSKIALPEFCYDSYQEMLLMKNIISVQNFKQVHGENSKRKFASISNKKNVLSRVIQILEQNG